MRRELALPTSGTWRRCFRDRSGKCSASTDCSFLRNVVAQESGGALLQHVLRRAGHRAAVVSTGRGNVLARSFYGEGRFRARIGSGGDRRGVDLPRSTSSATSPRSVTAKNGLDAPPPVFQLDLDEVPSVPRVQVATRVRSSSTLICGRPCVIRRCFRRGKPVRVRARSMPRVLVPGQRLSGSTVRTGH